MSDRFLKIIACEIALREICHVAARSPSLLDLEFVTQGLHDIPCSGGAEIQRRIDAVPAGKYDAILIGYGLCGNLISGLRARHTPLVIPRAHDCITFFLGSKERYQEFCDTRTGSYYYTPGWLECLRRRGTQASGLDQNFLPTRAGAAEASGGIYEQWVVKYGEEQARYLREVMDQWTQHYSHGVLIDYDFAAPLRLDGQVKEICAARGWKFESVPGDLALLQRWVDGDWNPEDFLVLRPDERIAPSYHEGVIEAEPAPTPTTPASTPPAPE
jgi:hypothetical protein